jgi:hypothetical protein
MCYAVGLGTWWARRQKQHKPEQTVCVTCLRPLARPVLRICDILVRIWTRTSDYFEIFVRNLKIFLTFFAYYFLTVHLHYISKIKSHKEDTKKTVGIKVSHTIFA